MRTTAGGASPILCCCCFAGRVASFKATSGHQAAVRCAFATSDLSRSPSGHRVLQAHSKHGCRASLVSSCYLCRACWALHCRCNVVTFTNVAWFHVTGTHAERKMWCDVCRWRAYFTSGSSAAYLFLYSMFYFWTKLDITRYVPMVMYFGYMAIVSYGFFCMTGTIGFFACWVFVRQIYAAVKID